MFHRNHRPRNATGLHHWVCCLAGLILPLLASNARAQVTIFSDQSNTPPNATTAFASAAGPLRTVDFTTPERIVETNDLGTVYYQKFSGLCFEKPHLNGGKTSIVAGGQTDLRADLPPNTYAAGFYYY